MAVAMCGKCRRLISLSAIPGGNPIARIKPGIFATHYTKCAHCGRLFCDVCIRSNGEKCPACGREVKLEGGMTVVPIMRESKEMQSQARGLETKEHQKIGRTCASCGVGNEDANTFCTGCGERLIRESPAVELGGQTVAAQPDATQFTEPTSTPEADQAVKTQLTESQTINADQSQVKEQAVPAEWKVGDVILDLYEVKDLLGEGGFGRVYKVHHRDWNTDLAVKSPRAEQFETDAQRDNFVRECETWIQLGMHPHIVSCYYVRTIGKVPHVFAEYVEGGSLHDWIEDRRLYKGGKDEALRRILDISIQFAWGLHYAHTHEQGLIHQDVKPANVLITTEGEAKVTDFGLARARGVLGTADSGETRTILVASGGMTPAYCSPEQVEGKPLSRKTDIWSWGLSVLEMFFGERTWRSGTLAEVALTEYLKTGVSDKSIPRMPEALSKLLKECFQQNPENRPKDFQKIVKILRTIYEYKDEGIGEEYPREEPEAVDLLADSLNNKAVSMLALGRSEEAEDLFNQILEQEPNHPRAIYNLGLLLWRSGRISDDVVVRQIEEVRNARSGDWLPEYLLGLVHIERGDASLAHKTLEAALFHTGGVRTEEDGIFIRRIIKQTHKNEPVLRALELAKAGKDNRSARTGRTGAWVTYFGLLRGPGRMRDFRHITMSSNGKVVLAGGSRDLYLWELPDRDSPRTLGCFDVRMTALDLSKDGAYAVVGGYPNTALLLDIRTGNCLQRFADHEGAPHLVSLTPDGEYVLTADRTNIRCWDAKTSEVTWTLPLNSTEEPLRILCFAPVRQHKQILLATSRGLLLWDTCENKCVLQFSGHKELSDVSCIDVSSNGEFAITGHRNGSLALWHVSGGIFVRSMPCSESVGEHEGVKRVCISGDGTLAISVGRRGRWWDLKTGRCLFTFAFTTDFSTSGALSDDGQVAVMLENIGCTVYGLARGVPQAFSLSFPKSGAELNVEVARAAKLNEQASSCLAAGRFAEAYAAAGQAMLLSGHRHDVKLITIREDAGLHGRIESLADAWQQDAFRCDLAGIRWGFVGSDDQSVVLASLKELRVLDLREGTCRQSYELGTEVPSLAGLDISEELQLLAVCGEYGGLFFRDFKSGEEVWQALCSHSKATAVALSTNRPLGISGGRDGRLNVWDLKTGRIVRDLRIEPSATDSGHFENPSAVTSLAISRDSRIAVAGHGNGIIRIWDLQEGRCILELMAHDREVHKAILSEDCSKVLSAGSDRNFEQKIRLWDLSSGSRVTEVEAHSELCRELAFSPDGNFALTGSDFNVRLWSLRTGECLRLFQGHTRRVVSVAFLNDANRAFSVDDSGTVILWKLVWEYEFPDPGDWDDGVQAYLEIFLMLHCAADPDRIGWMGTPMWGEAEFLAFIKQLRCRGYGWLRPEAVRRKLEEMTASWDGAPPIAVLRPVKVQEEEKKTRRNFERLLGKLSTISTGNPETDKLLREIGNDPKFPRADQRQWLMKLAKTAEAFLILNGKNALANQIRAILDDIDRPRA